MLLNTLRLNHQPSTHPNDRIVFIKPLPRPPSAQADYERAETTLKAIAAQCLPIMKGHHLSCTTLEEHEPNPEFIGRNFNNGEVTQLVLQSRSGAWLPLHTVQMVMMHELAHNTHMNHGKGFWDTRNRYVEEMKGLWERGYTGDGLWGKGRNLGDATGFQGIGFAGVEELAGLPVCGGTYRSRRRKRTRKQGVKEDLTWREKKERRIEKKFGRNGSTLGEDEDQRMLLEINGKRSLGGKPRVAQSKRGRELRAAAALARLEANKPGVEASAATVAENDESTESEEYDEADVEQDDAQDGLGNRIVDRAGHGMIRVCAGVENDVEMKNELDEMNAFADTSASLGPEKTATRKQQVISKSLAQTDTSIEVLSEQKFLARSAAQTRRISPPVSGEGPRRIRKSDVQICSICTTENDPLRLTCSVCSHVLDPTRDARHWRCANAACTNNLYINAGDCGICGVCGSSRSHVRTGAKSSTARVLRDGLINQSGHIAHL